MASEKISEMPLINSGYIQSAYLEFPVLHGNSSANTNNRLRYNDLMQQLQGDLNFGGGGAEVAMFALTPIGNASMNSVFSNWNVNGLIVPDFVYWTGSMFQLSGPGIYKISVVANYRLVDSYGYDTGIPWPTGQSETGVYINRDSYYAAVMIPPSGYRTSHGRYLGGSDFSYIQRAFQMNSDEFFIDYRDNSNPNRGLFNIGSFMSSGSSDVPYQEIVVTVSRVGG